MNHSHYKITEKNPLCFCDDWMAPWTEQEETLAAASLAAVYGFRRAHVAAAP